MTGASLRSEPPLLPPFQLRPHGPWPLTHHASAGAGERRRAKAGEPGFPGRAARHRHTPQWFLQHGSGPTPHGLAGHSVCFLKCVGVCGCVCLRACVCVLGGVGGLVAASPNANACRFKKWEPFLSSSVFPRWKGLLRPSGAGSYFFPLQKDREPERCTCHPF